MLAEIADYLDPIASEQQRDDGFLHLTANETWMSDTARGFGGSRIAERYFTGAGDDRGVVCFGPFTFVGFPGIAELLSAAEMAATDMLGAAAVNVNPVSGIHAMMCVLLALTEPGAAVVSVDPERGGHFATSGVIERSGRRHVSVPYREEDHCFDPGEVACAIERSGARAFYIDVSSNIGPHNLAEIRRAVGPDILLVYDASHTLGLIMGDAFQRPFAEGADLICGNTHKTFPGPQKGLIAFADADLAEEANAIINRWFISSTHTASMIALGVTTLEMQCYGGDYAQQVIANSNALGRALADAGLEVRTIGTGEYSANHQVHVFCDEFGTPAEVAGRLAANRIAVNVDQALGSRSYLRLGTQELTRRGMREAEMDVVAGYVARALSGEEPRSGDVALFVADYRTAHFSFDPGWVGVA